MPCISKAKVNTKKPCNCFTKGGIYRAPWICVFVRGKPCRRNCHKVGILPYLLPYPLPPTLPLIPSPHPFPPHPSLSLPGASRAAQAEVAAKASGLFEMLNTIAQELGADTSPQTLARCADFLVKHKQFVRAIELYVMAKRYVQAIEMCEKQKVGMMMIVVVYCY